MNDDTLLQFDAHGALALPKADQEGTVQHGAARLWYSVFGTGKPVILLHGGLGNSNNWGYQVPALLENGFQVILTDSRGHGRSSFDGQLYFYEQMAGDVLAVMDELNIERADLVGWSDGAVISLTLAMKAPQRVKRVFYFACNVDLSGTKPFQSTPVIEHCLSRHVKDYQQLSTTPEQFAAFSAAVNVMMEGQPNYTQEDLAAVSVPVAVVLSRQDEFIRFDHAEYIAESIPDARLITLEGVTHFAPLQRPDYFNEMLLDFLIAE